MNLHTNREHRANKELESSSEVDPCLQALRKRLLAKRLRKHVGHNAQTPAALIVKNNIYFATTELHSLNLKNLLFMTGHRRTRINS